MASTLMSANEMMGLSAHQLIELLDLESIIRTLDRAIVCCDYEDTSELCKLRGRMETLAYRRNQMREIARAKSVSDVTRLAEQRLGVTEFESITTREDRDERSITCTFKAKDGRSVVIRVVSSQ